MMKMQYLVRAAKPENAQAHEQTFSAFAAAKKARDYLRSKGYRAHVTPVVGKIGVGT